MSLLSIEWLKIKSYRTFWIISGLFALLFICWNLLLAEDVINFGPVMDGAYSFPMVWSTLGWWISVFVIFLSILIITITCNEYTFRTHRQNIIDGWTRSQFFHAKALVVLVLSASTALFLLVSGLVFGYSFGKGSAVDGIEQVAFCFVLTLNYLSAALLIAIMVRRSGLSIGLFLLYAIIVETILKFSLNHYTSSQIGNYFPLQASDELLPWPVLKFASRLNKMKPPPVHNTPYVLVSFAWISLYYLFTRRLIMKRDL